MAVVALAAVAILAGYVLGLLPTAVVVGRWVGHDPTAEGSGNPGATNVYRTAGRRAGAVVLAGDLLKGALAAGIGWAVGDHRLGLACGAAAVLGHVLPLTRRLRGGKGVATSIGVVLVLFPLHGLVATAAWAVVVRLTHRPSVASLVVAVGLPAGVAATGAPGVEVAGLVAIAAVVVLRHRGNIERLLRGDERPVEAGQ